MTVCEACGAENREGARFCDACGAALAAPDRREQRDAVTVEELPPLELKGKAQGVSAYRLLSVEAGAPGIARRADIPIVGREHERQQLESAFANAVRSRTCVLFSLLGAAGVGKSRLT